MPKKAYSKGLAAYKLLTLRHAGVVIVLISFDIRHL